MKYNYRKSKLYRVLPQIQLNKAGFIKDDRGFYPIGSYEKAVRQYSK